MLTDVTVFPVEHPVLNSLCRGLTDEGCGDDVDPGQALCPACIRESERPANSEWSAQYADGSGGLL